VIIVKVKLTNSQSGFTLVELLATLAISTILIGLIWGVLFTALNQNDIAQNHINLRQDANLFISKLRNKHQDQDYMLCYNNQKFYFGSADSPILDDDITFNATNASNVLMKNDSKNINENNDCYSINHLEPLKITLLIKDENQNEFQIDTVINRLGKYQGTPGNNGGNQQTGDEAAFDESSDFEENIQMDPSNFSKVSLDPYQGEVTGNSTFKKSNLAANYKWYQAPKQTHVIDGSAHFSNGLELYGTEDYDELKLVIDQDLFVDGSAHLVDNMKLNVKGNTLIQGTLTQNGSNMTVEQNLFVKQKLELNAKNSQLYVMGSARINEGIVSHNGNTVTVDYNLFTGNEIKLTAGSRLIINGDVHLEEGTNFTSWDNSEFIVDGVVHIGNTVYDSDFTYSGFDIVVRGN